MDSLRLSVSDIDQYRYFLAHEEMDISELLARLRRQQPPTEQMAAGTALHKALEVSKFGHYDTLKADGYTFQIECDAVIDMPMGRELKATKQYMIDNCIITAVGKVDAIHGSRIEDHKMTGQFDPERFLSGFQWRFYLDIFDASEFRWNVFEARPSKDDDHLYVIKAVHFLSMHRYPAMEADIQQELCDYLAFVRQHMPEKIVRAA